MIDYKEFVKDVNNKLSRKLALHANNALTIEKFPNPVSITNLEFNEINKIVSRYNLKSGFEVATAFGISALAPSLVFKENGGKLYSMDSYVEERTKSCSHYIDQPIQEVKEEPIGYQVAKEISAAMGTEDACDFRIGRSPFDLFDIIREDDSFKKFDYVFIDAEHTDLAISHDIVQVCNFLNDKFVMLFHDGHILGETAKKTCRRLFGKDPQFIFPFSKKWIEHYNPMILKVGFDD